MVVDELARRWGAPGFRDKFKGEFTKVAVGGDDVVLLKPMTFMNLSGESVQAAMRFFNAVSRSGPARPSLSQTALVKSEIASPGLPSLRLARPR